MIVCENISRGGDAFAPVNEGAPHSRRTVGVVVIVALQHIGEKQELEHEEEDKELHEDKRPQVSADRHAAEAIHIKAENPHGENGAAGGCGFCVHRVMVFISVYVAKLTIIGGKGEK